MLRLLAWLVLLPVALLLWLPILGLAVMLFTASPDSARDQRQALPAHEQSVLRGGRHAR